MERRRFLELLAVSSALQPLEAFVEPRRVLRLERYPGRAGPLRYTDSTAIRLTAEAGCCLPETALLVVERSAEQVRPAALDSPRVEWMDATGQEIEHNYYEARRFEFGPGQRAASDWLLPRLAAVAAAGMPLLGCGRAGGTSLTWLFGFATLDQRARLWRELAHSASWTKNLAEGVGGSAAVEQMTLYRRNGATLLGARL